jgi:UDP-2,3-diacylglucosamine pyrophosphatase LpxH
MSAQAPTDPVDCSVGLQGVLTISCLEIPAGLTRNPVLLQKYPYRTSYVTLQYMKIYCASDLHLGYPESNYQKILSFLDIVQKDADQFILLGDVFDLWVNEFNVIKTQEPMKSCYEALVKTSINVKTVIVWGNHDYDLASLSSPFNVTDSFVQDDIFFSHGWRWDAEQRLGYPFYGWIVEFFPYIYQRFFQTPFQVINNQDVYTKKVADIRRAAERFVEKKGYKYVVFGHTHYGEVNNKLVNCGDFIGSCSYIVIEDGLPRLMKV